MESLIKLKNDGKLEKMIKNIESKKKKECRKKLKGKIERIKECVFK